MRRGEEGGTARPTVGLMETTLSLEDLLMARMPYPTDLSPEQWYLIEPWIPRAQPGGRPREVDMREVINAIWYVL